MTICIGALCAEKDKASGGLVICSDRMVTWGGITEFEHEIPKITEVTPRIVTMAAGDALRGSRIARDVTAQVLPDSSVENVANAISQRYVESRRQQIEAEVFQPRGMTMQDFYQGQQQRMIAPIAGQIDEQVLSFNFGLEILVAGVDDRGAHLYWVANPGGSVSHFHQIGFHAIGSGMLHALQSIIGFRHVSTRSLHETLFTVYASKKRAEVAPGVGSETDLAVITQDGITWARPDELVHLQACYEKIERPKTTEIIQELKDCGLFVKVEGESQNDTSG